MNTPILGIIVPCYNEVEALRLTNHCLLSELNEMIDKNVISKTSFICYVNDGSQDGTWELIQSFNKISSAIQGINLSRNFGHQAALLAGLYTATADIYISIDADLQDDIKIMKDMISLYKQGNDIVYGCRENRSSDTFFKRNSAILFYKIRNILGCKTIYNHADYRLLSARVVKTLKKCHETNLYLRGIIPQLGFSSAKVYYTRKSREQGLSKYPLKKMLALALNGIINFSTTPLLLIVWVGLLGILISVGITCYSLIAWMSNNTLPGWTSTILTITFCSSLQILSLGCVGLYIGKIFQEVKSRPVFIVQDFISNTEHKFMK